MALLPIVAKVEMPTLLAGAFNGELDQIALEEVQPGIWLQRDAARSFGSIREAAHADHVELRVEYGYRDYATQKSIFLNRYVTDYIAGTEQVMWNGQRFFKLPGVDAAAVPGTSNHGWGLAVDFANARTASTPTVRWMIDHAHEHGWSAELQSEAWHWRRHAGNYTAPRGDDDMTDAEMRTLAQYIAEALDARPRRVHDYNAGADIDATARNLDEWAQMELQQIRRK